ncbi:MAG: polyphosphate kinase 1, partial [Selenomonadales bacterium]|nr:polyphosphate kinase 1 [Selenomonadales bacterium]
MMCEKNKPCYLQNRELSWLMFDRRVLEEAEDTTVPLLERLRFISIFTSNLDEFFMVRVGSLGDLSLLKKEPIDNKTGMTVEAQLKAICKRTTSLYQAKDRVYGEVEMLLRQHGIVNLSVAELTEGERAYVERYFDKMIRPLLSPQIIDLHHPFPHIANKTPHIAVRLRRGKKEYFGMIPTASSLPRVIRVSENEVRYLLLETILLQYADAIFDGFTVMERAVFCVTRSADLNLDDDILDADSTYLTYMKRILKKRPRLRVVRLETDRRLSEELLGGLLKRLRLKRERVWVSRSPLEMSYVPRVIDMVDPVLKKELTYPAFVPQYPDFYMPKRSIIRAIEERDRLLFYPYHTFDIFTELLREAMCDEAVISIKITVYRLAERDSKLAAYLIGAAEAGKDVTVLMELTARFDEQNNIDWAERLEAAGCRVLYGVEGVKVHGKICLIGRRCKGGLQYITQVGTGNYNEETAMLYTDISLFTSNIHIGKEAALFFQNMGVGN